MTTTKPNTSVDAHALLGAWRLAEFYIESSDGNQIHPFGVSPEGMLIYTDTGNMSAQLMASNRPLFADDDQLNGSADEIEASFKKCVAYFGQYEVDVEGGFVVHHVQQSLFPNWNGKPQKRFVQLHNNQLRITTPPVTWGGVEKVAVLVWER